MSSHVARDRRALGKTVASSTHEHYCYGCDQPFLPRGTSFSYCKECVRKNEQKYLIYDRDRGIGQLPANLLKYVI